MVVTQEFNQRVICRCEVAVYYALKQVIGKFVKNLFCGNIYAIHVDLIHPDAVIFKPPGNQVAPQ